MTELELYELSITPKHTTEHLLFSLLPALLMLALIGLGAYGLFLVVA